MLKAERIEDKTYLQSGFQGSLVRASVSRVKRG